MITPLENLRILLEGGSPDWIPFSIDVGACAGLTDPIQREFIRRTGATDPAEHFDTDYRCFSLRCRFGGEDPMSMHDSLPPGTICDEWGIGHYGGQTEATVDKQFPPLAQAVSLHDVEALPSPIVERGVDLSPIHDFHRRGYPAFAYAGSIYEWSWWLGGMELFLMDLAVNPVLAEAVLHKVEEHTTNLALASAAAGADVLCFYDDAGTQRGMQISPEMWRRYIKPAWHRVLEAVRAEHPRVCFFLHSCGRIDPIIPDIIELGFHVLHPVQPECMDYPSIWRQYGKHVVLAACISAQRVLPFGSPEDVGREVERLKRVAGESRRAILLPSNRVQPETPWENIMAFVDACRGTRR